MSWADFRAEGYEFKVIDEYEDDEIYCKFRVTPENAFQKTIMTGTVFDIDRDTEGIVSSCQINGNNYYGPNITGSCVFQLRKK